MRIFKNSKINSRFVGGKTFLINPKKHIYFTTLKL